MLSRYSRNVYTPQFWILWTISQCRVTRAFRWRVRQDKPKLTQRLLWKSSKEKFWLFNSIISLLLSRTVLSRQSRLRAPGVWSSGYSPPLASHDCYPRRSGMERTVGLQPTTSNLEGWRSKQLSYARIGAFFHRKKCRNSSF